MVQFVCRAARSVARALVEEHYAADIDFAQLVKQYAQPRTDGPNWFRPSSHVVAAIPTPIIGEPEMTRISTSHIERANLTVADAPAPVHAPDVTAAVVSRPHVRSRHGRAM